MNKEAREYLDGVVMLITEAEQREAEAYYAEVDARQEAEMEAVFAQYDSYESFKGRD